MKIRTTVILGAFTVLGLFGGMIAPAQAQTDTIIRSQEVIRLQELLAVVDSLRAQIVTLLDAQIDQQIAITTTQQQLSQIQQGQTVDPEAINLPAYQNLIVNGDFEIKADDPTSGGIPNWINWVVDDLGTWQHECDEETGNCYAVVDPSRSLATWQAQIVQPVLVSDQYDYLLTFDAEGQVDGQEIQTVMALNEDPWTELVARRNVVIENDWTPVRHVFSPDASSSVARFAILAGSNRDVRIDNVVLIARPKADTAAEEAQQEQEAVNDAVLIVDADFEDGVVQNGYFWSSAKSEGEVVCTGDEYNCVFSSTTDNERFDEEDAEFVQDFVADIKEGDQLVLTFDAKADPEKSYQDTWFMRAYLDNNQSPTRRFDGSEGFLVTRDWQTFTHTFEADRADVQGRLALQLADSKGTIMVDNITVQHISDSQ